jgi:3-oxoadipate enol-lactonase
MRTLRESKFVDLHGHPTFLDLDGTADAPLMVCLHGLGGSSNYFQPLISTYAARFRIARIDLKGLGRTGPATAPAAAAAAAARRITVPAYVEDLAALLDLLLQTTQQQQPPVVLVGHSLGAIVAMQFAAAHPARVAALALLGPGRSRASIPAARAFTLSMAAGARGPGGMPAVADGAVAKNVAPSSSDVVRAFVREVVAGQSGEGYAQVCEALCDDTHVDPDYGLITSPTMIVAGDQDLISSVDQAKGLQSDIKGSQLSIVHSGHQHVLEDPAGVIKAINTLLEQVTW